VSETAKRLRDAVEAAMPKLLAIDDARAAEAIAPGKWSRKETLGHLIDSASNNHGRFVRAALSDQLVAHGYEQERWVELQSYKSAPWASLVALWREFNLHIARVIEAMPDDARSRSRTAHNLDEIGWNAVPKSEPVTLDYFMDDYVGHLEHHLQQILPSSKGTNR
jgi:hypothetical protein